MINHELDRSQFVIINVGGVVAFLDVFRMSWRILITNLLDITLRMGNFFSFVARIHFTSLHLVHFTSLYFTSLQFLFIHFTSVPFHSLHFLFI